MKRSLLLVLVASGVLLSLDGSDMHATAAVLAQELDDCVQCHEDCPVGQHLAANAGTYTLPTIWWRNGGAHNDGNCYSNSCEYKHGPDDCEGGEMDLAEVEQLREAIVKQDPRSFRRLVAAHPNRILVNAKRAAVQIAGCQGAIIAHFPVESRLLAALAE